MSADRDLDDLRRAAESARTAMCHVGRDLRRRKDAKNASMLEKHANELSRALHRFTPALERAA